MKENQKEIKILLNEYNHLKITEAKYWQLEAAGVDNWTFYGCNCQDLGADECIFCTEDEIEFLGLDEKGDMKVGDTGVGDLEDILVTEDGGW